MAKPTTIKVGMIGLGGVAQAHLQAFELLAAEGNSCVSLVAVCDVRQEAADTVAERFTVAAFADYHALLEQSDIDVAMVLTPASTHRAIVEAAAAKGIDVFCEKPIAVTAEDAEAMVDACANANEGRGVRLFYGSCYRYLPAIIKAKAVIAEGAIGDVQLMTEQAIGGHGIDGYTELAPIHYPLGGPGGPGMGLVDHGVHLIDIFPWLTDSTIVAAHGRGSVSGQAAGSEYMVMQLANGAVGHLLYNAATYTAGLPSEGMFSGGQAWLTDATVADAGGWENDPGSISIYGSHGALRIFHYTNALFINNGDGPQKVSLEGRAAFGHFASQLEDIAETIVHNKQPSINGAAGVTALKALLQVYRSPSLLTNHTLLEVIHA
ncbi:MAG: Gfo/Idh/MocA family oxidoreductase [Oceanicoccus sp.]|uniref:Gfo/Idh/MocA family protein n=1 Tax=Oceanicoccus sp. TaxID=2691044 RepID=UPI0026213FAC|nr:Gfo/Idh/MocA family oxidoreductase [Oceanicoccus sp.]MDG1772188.1 Gfo/Idh/MocA family oxidoreductase [Oceanicoccus sp.]